MLNIDTLFDDENKEELNALESNSADLVTRLSNTDSGNAALEEAQTGKNFDEISRRMWSDLRFVNSASDSQETAPCESLPFKTDFYTGGIDFFKLIRFIKTNYTEIFDFTKFEGIKVQGSYTSTSPSTIITTTSSYSDIENVSFEYTDSIGIRRTTNLSGRLNRRVCYLEQSPPNLQSGWQFELDPKKEKINCTLSFYYKGTYKLRQDLPKTPEQNDYSLEDQYKAIIISTKNANDFVALMKEIYSDYTSRETAKDIAKKYVSILKDCKDGGQLKFLYNNIPDFVIEDIKTYGTLSTEILWNHLLLLTQYDDRGLLSWFKDASSALINVLKAIGDSKILYKKFLDDPTFIRRIYYNLDGSSEVPQPGINANGSLVMSQVLVSNRIIFANFLTALCIANKNEGLANSNKKFYYGKEYKFDANVTGGYNANDDKFFLKQLKKVTRQEILIIPDDLPSKVERIPIETSSFEEVDEGAYFKPLDLVTLIDVDNENEDFTTVPAILIKALSDEVEWQVINRNIRIGFDILGLVLGIILVITTSSPVIFALSLADIGISGTDLYVQSYYDEIAATPEGRKFLAVWEKVYLIGNLITASPAIIGGVFKAGTLLLKTAEAIKNFDIRNFVLACFTRIIIERNIINFAKGSLELVTDIKNEFGAGALFDKLTTLQKEGVSVFKGSFEGENIKQFCLFFQGKILSIGDLRKLITDVSEILKAKGASLLEKINEFLLFLRKEKTLVNTSAKIGDEASIESIKWGTVRMRMHPRFEEIMKFLKDRKVELMEIEDIANDVAYTETMIYDKFDNLLRVEKKIDWHPEMRFLDLEHEVDHIIQFERNLEGKYCTEMKKFLGEGRIPKDYFNSKLGFTTRLQKALLEYDVRINEIVRLKERSVATKILEEHFEGLQKGIDDYNFWYDNARLSERRLYIEWKNKYFPNFKELSVKDLR